VVAVAVGSSGPPPNTPLARATVLSPHVMRPCREDEVLRHLQDVAPGLAPIGPAVCAVHEVELQADRRQELARDVGLEY
jgi:hypothetical protein